MAVCPGCGYKKNDEFAEHCKRCSFVLLTETSSWEQAEPQIRIAVPFMVEPENVEPAPTPTADKLRGMCDLARKSGIITPKGAVLLDQVIGFLDSQVLSDPDPASAVERTVEMLGNGPLGRYFGGERREETVERAQEAVKQVRTVLKEAPQASRLLGRLSADLHAPHLEGVFEEVLPTEK